MSDTHSSKTKKIVNQPSLLLDNADNDTLFRLLGPSCYTLSSAVVQLLESNYPLNTEWDIKGSGVACFVKDFKAKSYFIRIFDIKAEEMVWEHELYKMFQYNSPRDFFHTFESNNAQIGLNFASEDEAQKFRNAIHNLLHHREQRRMTRKSKKSRDQQPRTYPSSIGFTSSPPLSTQSNLTPQTGILTSQTDNFLPAGIDTVTNNLRDGRKELPKEKDMKKHRIKREDISSPFNFRVVNSVAHDKNRGFHMSGLEEDMKRLLHVLGVNPDDQVDMATIRFVLDFVNNNGGIQAVRKEMTEVPAAHTSPPSVPIEQAQMSSRQLYASKAVLDRKQLPLPPPPPTTPLSSDNKDKAPDSSSMHTEKPQPLPPKPQQTLNRQTSKSTAQSQTVHRQNQTSLLQNPLHKQDFPPPEGPQGPSDFPARMISDMTACTSFCPHSTTTTSSKTHSLLTSATRATSVPRQSQPVKMASSPCQPPSNRPRRPPPALPIGVPNSSSVGSQISRSVELESSSLTSQVSKDTSVDRNSITCPSKSLLPPHISPPPPPPPPPLSPPNNPSTEPTPSSASSLPFPPKPPAPPPPSAFPPLPGPKTLSNESETEQDEKTVEASEPPQRNNLTAFLEEIAKGRHLNPVERRETREKHKLEPISAPGSIISQLVDAFHKMRPHIEPDDEDYDSDEFHWEDI